MSRGLPFNVKRCLEKAHDSALLAVEIYNKPAVKFKSGGYIVLMCIAWTSLFHAIFFNKHIKPFYRDKNGTRFKRVNDEIQFWELSTCVKEYFKGEECAIKKNIEFFIPLRNKLEHRSLPELDPDIFAECESFLLNFDKIMEKEFGESFCLRESLSFALQLFPSSKTLRMSIKSEKDSESVSKFIKDYRSSINSDILQSGEYAFKAFLIQVCNHKSADALPIQFYRYDELPEERKKEIDRFAGLVKEKQIPVANKNKFKPGTVVEMVQKYFGNKTFNQYRHTSLWKKYAVRPESNSHRPELTKPEYCVYDEPNNSYLYTQKWIDFIINIETKDKD